MTIYQFVAGFRVGDAISNEAMLIEKMLSGHGYQAKICAPRISTAPRDRHFTLDAAETMPKIRPDDLVLLHLSIGSIVNSLFEQVPCKKVILYHNVTPGSFFERLNPATAAVLSRGRDDVRKLAHSTPHVYADSAFNAQELLDCGYPVAKVLPLLLDEHYGEQTPDAAYLEKCTRTSRTRLLFVGRLAPNKRHDRLLHVFSAYQKYENPESELIIAGGGAGMDAYRAILLSTVHTLMLRNVTFTGFLSDAELAACYAASDAFVCLSEHEGFCAPLLEAMAWKLPVFANAAGAVPETMDGAGVLFHDATPEQMAAAIHRVLSTSALREQVISRQNARLARFRAREAWQELSAALFS